jgi:hypothetical protein
MAGLDDVDLPRRQAVPIAGDGDAFDFRRKMFFNGEGHRSGGLAGGDHERAPLWGLRQVGTENLQRIGGGDRRPEALLEQRAH